MFVLSFSILIIKMERNEYVTRKNISTESHMIFFLQYADEYVKFQFDFSLRWTCRNIP